MATPSRAWSPITYREASASSFGGELWPIERLLYKRVRCELIHTGAVPLDIEVEDDLGYEGLSVRAGGDPERLLKLSPSWFDFLVSIADG